MSNSELIVGIDLGTTNSLIAICDECGPRVVCDSEGRAVLPSVVRFPRADAGDDGGGRGGDPIIGYDARAHAVEYPERTVYSVKRLMGRGFADVKDDVPHLPFTVVPGEHDTVRVAIDDRIYTPQEISALILRELKLRAELALHREVRKAVVTVPAYFDDAQRQATRDAGRLAGLDVVRIVNEPTAAALAYGIGQRQREPEIIAVYDLGGGTFDVSILQVTPGGSGEGEEEAASAPDETGNGNSSAAASGGDSYFQVLATAGDTHLGGDDVDRMIMELVCREIREQLGTELQFPPSTRQAMRNFAEATKIRLSDEQAARLEIDLGDGRRYQRLLERDELNRLIEPWVRRTISACERALRDAKLTPRDINRVVMVGGSTRIPLVREMIGDFFGCEPYTALDPDQVVALGAAVQASILSGVNRDMLLLDVIPLSLGIETVGGAVAKLIMRNTTVPTRATEMFSTSVDGQTNVKIHVLQGERELAKDCRSLGEFHLRGIPPMPAGIPQIEVEFLVDANGILSVQAVERRSGKRASIQVVPRYGLTREEVDRMEAESYAHAREDMHAHRVIDLAVNSQLDIKWIRQAMQRVGDELDPAYRAQLEQAIAALEVFIAQSRHDAANVDADAFYKAKEALDKTSVRLHEQAITKSLASET